ncbi:MAG: hypothetical protein AAB523_03435 [Patescibacteria group bacterium]
MNNKTIVNIILAIIVVVAGYYIYNITFNNTPSSEEEKPSETTTTTIGDIQIEGKGDHTIEVLPATVTTPNIPVPDLDRPIVFSSTMSPEAQAILKANIETVVSDLKKDSNQANKWLALGINRKIAGDIEGARLAWEYAAALQPLNSVPFFNLGDLDHYYLKNFAQAEKNLRQAITNDPSFIQAYRSLFELYALSYTEKAYLADDILLEGLKKNPNNIDLLIPLAEYYKGTGKTEEARKYYEMALTEAQKAGNTALVELLKSELNTL